MSLSVYLDSQNLEDSDSSIRAADTSERRKPANSGYEPVETTSLLTLPLDYLDSYPKPLQ